MSTSEEKCDSELIENIDKRGKEILENFSQIVVSGVSNLDLLKVIADVTDYWKDSYRPALISLSCEAVGGQPDDADAASLMLSVMSAGLGIHDDIIDQSKHKHFRMTLLGLHEVHGQEKALLVGDLFLVKSLIAAKEILKYSPEKTLFILDIFERFFIEIWEGEYMEIQCRKNLENTLEEYQEVLWKSAADTEACTRIGAFFGNGSFEETEALAEFGRRLGYMYRLTDEIKDTLNIEGNFHDRLQKESVPLPILYAAKSSRDNYLTIRSILEKNVISSEESQAILKTCFETNALAYVKDLINENYKDSISRLRSVKKSHARGILEAMASKCLSDSSKLTS